MSDATSSIVSLDALSAADEPRAGAKAGNCARLKQAGFPVPGGVVVLATAADADLAAVARHAWFDDVAADAAFAVRSSGLGEDSPGHSFAGIHQTRLNVPRAGLPAAIAACRASAGSPQAIAYRQANGLPAAAGIGVLVQAMIDPIVAGVAFTVNPVGGAQDEMVINASWGLGEALVSGAIDPDEFVLTKADGALKWSRIGEKDNGEGAGEPSLTPPQLRELAALLRGVERHYGAPQDIEWCHDGRRFWIVQSRPITTARPAAHEIEWTRANVAEVLPDLTSPQALAAFEDLLNRAERMFLRGLTAPEDRLGPIVKSFAGRLYFNLSQFRHVCAMAGVPPAQLLKSVGHAGVIQPQDETAAPVTRRQRLGVMPTLLRLGAMHLRPRHVMRRHDARVARFMQVYGSLNAAALPDRDLWAHVEAWIEQMPEAMQPVLLFSGVLFHEMPLRKALERAGVPFEALVYPQLAAGERSVSAEQAFDLTALAATARRQGAVDGTGFLDEFNRFIDRYGHRGRYESDWALPRYSEDASPLLAAIAAHADDARPAAGGDRRQQDREAAEAWRAFEGRLTRWQRWTLLPRVRRSIRTIKRYYLWREQVRSDLMKTLAIFRHWHLVLARRFIERGWIAAQDEYFLLTLPEIGRVIRGEEPPHGLTAIVEQRRAERERYRRLQMPLLMRESELPALLRTAGITDAARSEGTLTGQPVSRGLVEGEVVVIRDPGDFARMKRGAILVAPATDPSWTPLFTLASGVIVEVGGVLSHASTIAREYGLPALANVRHATRRLRTGERVRLDAIHGRVQRLP